MIETDRNKKLYYSETGSRLLKMKEQIDPLNYKIATLKNDLDELIKRRKEILEESENNRKPLPDEWQELNKVILQKSKEHDALVDLTNPQIDEYQKLLKEHNRQKELLHYLDEGKEFKN